MPLYEYQCDQCGRFEVIRKFSDDPLTACPTCGKPIEKLLSSPAIQFKGSGWYITDYARKSSGGSDKDSGKDAGKESSKGGKSEGTKTEKAESSKDSGSPAAPSTAAASSKAGSDKS